MLRRASPSSRVAVATFALIVAGCAAEPGASVPTVTTTAIPSPSAASSEDAADPSGRLEAAITGAAERTWDLELTSWEEAPDGTTILVYGSGSEAGLGETVAIQFNESEFSVNADGGSANVSGNSADTCTVAFDRQEADSIVGTFECPGITAISSGELVLGLVDFRGSFEADR